MAARSSEATRLRAERAAAEHDAKMELRHEEFQERAKLIRESGLQKGRQLTYDELDELIPPVGCHRTTKRINGI